MFPVLIIDKKPENLTTIIFYIKYKYLIRSSQKSRLFKIILYNSLAVSIFF